jgi:hypothetical protein
MEESAWIDIKERIINTVIDSDIHRVAKELQHVESK